MLATACTYMYYYVHVAVRSIAGTREQLVLTLFQVAFGLPIAFWTSVEGSVIEMKSATLVPQDTVVSLKA